MSDIGDTGLSSGVTCTITANQNTSNHKLGLKALAVSVQSTTVLKCVFSVVANEINGIRKYFGLMFT